MDTGIIIQGLIIGLILAVPIGPLSLLCIQRAIADGRLNGIVSGLGVATADSIYAAVAFLGLTAVSGFILQYQDIFRSIAGLVLIAVGIRIFFTRPGQECSSNPHGTLAKNYLSMVVITLANPMTIIFLVITLPGFGFIFGGGSALMAAEFVGGFFCGSALWWVVLCGSLGTVRSRLSTGYLVFINRASGLFIAGVGTIILITLALALAGSAPVL